MGLLRFLLAISVVLVHSLGFYFVGGQYAVQLFFIISGYLISYVIIESKSYPKARFFYASRAARIFPLYWLVLLATVLVMGLGSAISGRLQGPFEVFAQLPSSADLLLIVTQLSLIGQDQIMFTTINEGFLSWPTDFKETEVLLFRGLFVPQAWSLGVELAFYLIAPFVLKNRLLITVTFFFSVLLRAVLWALGLDQDPWSYRFFPTELALFLLGAVSHQLLAPSLNRFIGRAPKGASVVVVGIVGLLIAGYSFLPFDRDISSLVLFGSVAISLPVLFRFQATSSFDQLLARLSYPIYLWHIFVIWCLDALLPSMGNTRELRFAVIIAMTLALSWCSVVFVEAPIERLRGRFKVQVPQPLDVELKTPK